MSKKFSKEPLRGFKDYFPTDLQKDNWIIENIRDIADLYVYDEFEGPLLEPIEIFAAKSSDELVNQQSFIVEKKKGKRYILRPELTPSLARMISKKGQELKKPIRWFSVPTCYRYERPQRGRLREFKQINFDILGEDNLYAELEIFNIAIDILTSFGATKDQFQIYYNNRRFIDALCEDVVEVPKTKIPLVFNILDKYDKMKEDEYEKYLIDNFEEEHIIQGILKLKDASSVNELLKRFDNVPDKFYETKGYIELINLHKIIEAAGISEFCSFSSSIVRGLDYYTGTVFEVFDTGKENRRAIFGGGRYDDLLSLFSDEQLSGIGFGMGVLMLTLFLETYDLIPEEIDKKDYADTIYIASINTDCANYAIKLSKIIRNKGFPCIIDYKFKNLKTQLSKANDLGVLITLIIGQNEVKQNEVTIKNMVSNEQKTVNLNKLIKEIYAILDEYEENNEA